MRTVDGLPAAEIAIGGEKATFIIDVDANLIAVAPSLVQRLGLKPNGDTVRIPSLRLGTHELRDVDALVDPFLDRVHHDGVLGTPAYDRVLLTLDYPASQIRIEKGSLKGGLACAPELPDRCAIPITLAGESRLAIIDTAAKRPLLVPRDIALQLREKQHGIAAGPQTGTVAVEDATLDGDIVIAGHRVASPAITIHDRPRILIGSGLLRHFVVTFDLRNRRVLFATAPAPRKT